MLSRKSSSARSVRTARAAGRGGSSASRKGFNNADGSVPHRPPWLSSVTGDSTTGTADEAAAARDSGTAPRSEQMTSNWRWVKVKRAPVDKAVAEATISGPLPRCRSAKVAPLNRISSYNCAATSERPVATPPSVPQ